MCGSSIYGAPFFLLKQKKGVQMKRNSSGFVKEKCLFLFSNLSFDHLRIKMYKSIIRHVKFICKSYRFNNKSKIKKKDSQEIDRKLISDTETHLFIKRPVHVEKIVCFFNLSPSMLWL